MKAANWSITFPAKEGTSLLVSAEPSTPTTNPVTVSIEVDGTTAALKDSPYSASASYAL
jgi:hypothetical protein